MYMCIVCMYTHSEVRVQDALGWTPVVHTLLTYQPAMLKKLCDIGADVGVRDVAGNICVLILLLRVCPRTTTVCVLIRQLHVCLPLLQA